MTSNKYYSSGSLPAWKKWTGAETLDFVYALNERCLQELSNQVSEQGRVFLERDTFAIVRAWPDLWLQLDESARRRAANCPFPLLDVRFQCLK